MNMDLMLERAKSISQRQSFIRLEDGITKLRFIEEPGADLPYVEVYKHFLMDYISDDSLKVPICIGDESCPACQFSQQFRTTGDDQAANKTRAQHRFVFAAVHRDNPFDNDGNLAIKVIEVPPTVFRGLADILNEWQQEFTDPDTGFDIEIIRTRSSGFPKYEVKAVTAREQTEQGPSISLVRSPLTDEERTLAAEAYPNLSATSEPADFRLLAVALGMAVSEPDVMAEPARTPLATTPVPPPPSAPPRGDDSSNATPTESTAPDTTQDPAVPVATPVASPPPTPVPAANGAAEVEADCPYKGIEFDPNDDSCRSCEDAEPCQSDTEAKKQASQPQRRPR